MATHVPRFLVSSSQLERCAVPAPGEILVLEQSQFHHLSKVLRRGTGSEVELFFRDELRAFRAELLDSKQPRLSLRDELAEARVRSRVHLLLAQPKLKALELCVQHCSELGVSSIGIFPASRSPVPIPKNLRRLELLRNSAVEQARLTHVPQLLVYDSLRELLESLSEQEVSKILCTSTNDAAEQLLQVADLPQLLPRPPKTLEQKRSPLEKQQKSVEIYIAVGPEGGFSREEVTTFQAQGFVCASLGPFVARVETAAILASGICCLAAEES